MDLMTLISGIGQATNAYRAAVQTLDDAKITAATNELTGQLIQLGAEVLALQKDGLQTTERERATLTRIHELEDKVRELEKLRAERERYELVEPYSGTFALRVKEASRNGEPLHYLCPGCLDNKAVKSILQATSPHKTFLKCPACESLYRMADTPDGRPRARVSNPDGWMSS